MAVSDARIRYILSRCSVLGVVCCALVAIGFGGTEPYMLPIALMLTGAMSAVTSWLIYKEIFVFPRRAEILWLALLWLGIISWAVLQTLSAFGPFEAHGSWEALAEFGIERSYASISVSPLAGRREVLWYGIYAMVFVFAVLCARSATAVRTLLHAFVCLQLVFAIFALVLPLLPSTGFLDFYNRDYVGSLTSTFINRNSYATFVGLGLIVCISLAVRSMVFGEDRRSTPYLAIAAIILLGILIGTQSRAGIAAALLGCAASCLVLLWHLPKLKRLGLAVLSIALATMALIDFLLGRRVQPGTVKGDLDARLDIITLTVRAWRDSPWVGTGLGSFPDVASMYMQAADMSERTLHSAHNTYLEVLLELGTFGFLAVMALALWIFVRSVKPCFRNGNPPVIHYIALGIGVQIALHALVDFSMEIPAVVIALCLLMGAAYGSALFRSQPPNSANTPG